MIGNLNEHGLAIGETTFGGNAPGQHCSKTLWLMRLERCSEETLGGGEGVMDYGNLIWVTLQRSKTAREAILTFDKLVSEYGYVSDGESFTIADPNEACM